MGQVKETIKGFRAAFVTGLAVVLPGAISIAVVIWLFGWISNFTNKLLIFLPRKFTHVEMANGEWALHPSSTFLAFLLAVLGISMVGRLARNYFGRKLIQGVDFMLLKVPLLNRIYSTMKQVNDAFSPSNKSNFKQVVLVEFPRKGFYSMGFLTSHQEKEVGQVLDGNTVSIFVPTTPNPTTGFLLMMKHEQYIKLKMSVADGIKFIVSLGTISPDYNPTMQIEGKTVLSPAQLNQAAMATASDDES